MPNEAALVDTIRSRILRGVQLGTLSHGDRLSSARELAAELGVDHRAVLAAFKTLESEGLLDVRERGGAYVRHSAVRERLPWIPESWFVDTFVDAYARELSPAQLVEWLGRAVATVRLRAVVMAWTDTELVELEREIQRDFHLEIDTVQASDLGNPEKLALLRRADVLIGTTNVDETIHAIAKQLGEKPVILVETRPALTQGEWEVLLRKPLWVITGSAAFGQLLMQSMAHFAGADNLHVAVAGSDDIGRIPQDAPTYVTQRVRETLDHVGFKGRILRAPRSLTTNSARALLQFIVRTNIRASRALLTDESAR